MPHVSKNKLDGDALQDLTRRLVSVLAELTERGAMDDFLNDLLTRTEKIMLAKRLAIAIMLAEEYPFRIISLALKVSEATICAMRERMDKGGKGFALVARRLEREQKIEKILETINKLVRVFAMPPIAGKGRWRLLDTRLKRRKS